MSEVTMLSRMLARYQITIDRRPASSAHTDEKIRLITYDARLDTTTVYECPRALGVSGVITKAYADFQAEYSADHHLFEGTTS